MKFFFFLPTSKTFWCPNREYIFQPEFSRHSNLLSFSHFNAPPITQHHFALLYPEEWNILIEWWHHDCYWKMCVLCLTRRWVVKELWNHMWWQYLISYSRIDVLWGFSIRIFSCLMWQVFKGKISCIHLARSFLKIF